MIATTSSCPGMDQAFAHNRHRAAQHLDICEDSSTISKRGTSICLCISTMRTIQDYIAALCRVHTIRLEYVHSLPSQYIVTCLLTALHHLQVDIISRQCYPTGPYITYRSTCAPSGLMEARASGRHPEPSGSCDLQYDQLVIQRAPVVNVRAEANMEGPVE